MKKTKSKFVLGVGIVFVCMFGILSAFSSEYPSIEKSKPKTKKRDGSTRFSYP